MVGAVLARLRLTVDAVGGLDELQRGAVGLGVGGVAVVLDGHVELGAREALVGGRGALVQVDVVGPLLDDHVRGGGGAGAGHVLGLVAVDQMVAVVDLVAVVKRLLGDLGGVLDLHLVPVQGLGLVVGGQVAVMVDQPLAEADDHVAGVAVLLLEVVPRLGGLGGLSGRGRVVRAVRHVRQGGHVGQRDGHGLSGRVGDGRGRRGVDPQALGGLVGDAVGVDPRASVVLGVAVGAQVGDAVVDDVRDDVADVGRVVGRVLARRDGLVALLRRILATRGQNLLIVDVLDGDFAELAGGAEPVAVHRLVVAADGREVGVGRLGRDDHRLGGTHVVGGVQAVERAGPGGVGAGVEDHVDAGVVDRDGAGGAGLAGHGRRMRLGLDRGEGGGVLGDLVGELADGAHVRLVGAVGAHVLRAGLVPAEAERAGRLVGAVMLAEAAHPRDRVLAGVGPAGQVGDVSAVDAGDFGEHRVQGALQRVGRVDGDAVQILVFAVGAHVGAVDVVGEPVRGEPAALQRVLVVAGVDGQAERRGRVRGRRACQRRERGHGHRGGQDAFGVTHLLFPFRPGRPGHPLDYVRPLCGVPGAPSNAMTAGEGAA